MSHRGRIKRLEKKRRPSGEATVGPHPDLVAIFDEIEKVRSEATNYPFGPDLRPGEDSDELAIRRGLRSRGCYSPEEIETLTEKWMGFFGASKEELDAEIRSRGPHRGGR